MKQQPTYMLLKFDKQRLNLLKYLLCLLLLSGQFGLFGQQLAQVSKLDQAEVSADRLEVVGDSKADPVLVKAPVEVDEKRVYFIQNLDQLEARFANGGDTLFVVNFWATWCGPCVKELPYFEQVHNERSLVQQKVTGHIDARGDEHTAGESPVKVLLVSLDTKDRAAKLLPNFISKRDLKAEVVLLDEEKPRYFIDRVSEDWSGAIPATLFVRKSPEHRNFYEGEMTYDQLISIINPLLKHN